MLPVCSATPCSSHSQVFLNDGFRNLCRTQKAFDVRCISGDTAVSSLSSGVSFPGVSLQKEAASSISSNFIARNAPSSNGWRYDTTNISDPFVVVRENLRYVEDSSAAVSQDDQLSGILTDNAEVLLEPTVREPVTILDNVADKTANVSDSSVNSDSLSIPTDSFENALSQTKDSVVNSDSLSIPADSFENALSQTKESGVNSDSLSIPADSFENALSKTKESVGASISEGQMALDSSVDKVTSSVTEIVKDSNEAIESLTKKMLSSVDQTGELTRGRLNNLLDDLKEASNNAGVTALDLLRKTIIVAEYSFVKGAKFVYYSYESSKGFLPPEIQNAVVSFEEKASNISRPVGKVFIQVYSTVEGLERSLGLDPSDPIIPFVLFVGTTSALWAVYWVVTYSGYAGDLSPKSAVELISGKNDAVLIDVRPEDLRERDGVLDLRRAARFRYANVSLPKVDNSLRKLMKSSGDLDDAVIATVIRNLKNVRDRSKIIVMDADGSRSKSIARSLRKLGIKRPYILQGGFKSWVKEGLRIKELKPETALTILNEEAEAILEEMRPTPVQLLGIGVGSVAALYALVEWEKALQLIGVIGLGQVIYSRLASYEDPQDFRKDVGLLLSSVKFGAQAVSWAAGKEETNGNGLPVSPSSSDVQNRVLQAAAKHESQPYVDEGSQDTLLKDSTTTVEENADNTLSDA